MISSVKMQPQTPADLDVQLRRQIAMQSLRSMTTTEFIGRSTAEAFAAAAVCSPPFALFYFLDGCLNAKYPRVAVSQQLPPIPQTFAGLLGAGVRYSMGCTARTLLWATGSHALGTALREQMKVGWRYEDSPKDNSLFFLSGFASGAGMATLLTSDWAAAMGGARRAGYIVFGGMVGALLPDLMLRAGPAVRRKLESIQSGGSFMR